MIETKLFELRDRGTFIPVFALRCKVESLFVYPAPQEQARLAAEDYLLRRAGFAQSQHLVVLGKLSRPEETNVDPYMWRNERTLGFAHLHIEQNWDTLQSGQVICVEHLRGERPEPRPSERLVQFNWSDCCKAPVLHPSADHQDNYSRCSLCGGRV